MTYYTYTQTPVGRLLLIGDGFTVQGIHWTVSRHRPPLQPDWLEDASKFVVPLTQLTEYFDGQRQTFDLSVQAHGTPFQRRIWQQLRTIGYGETRTYQQIARSAGVPKAARAVGAAVGRNPLGIIVPCHRVIATSGRLTGFAGGLAGKRALLELEGGLPPTRV